IVVLAKPGQDLTPGEHLGYQLISSTALLAPQNIQKIAIAILEKEMPDGVRRKSTIRTPDLRSEWPAKQTTLVLRINYAALSPETPDRDPAVALTVTALYPLFKESGIRNWYRTAWESYPSIFFVDKDLQVSQRNLEEAMSGLFAHIAQNLCLNLGKYSKSDLKSNCTKENE